MASTSIGSLYGWSESDLLTALRSATKDLADGRSIITAGAGDISSGKQVHNNPRERIIEIKSNLGTLYTQDPLTYPQYAGFVNEGCNLLRATFV